MLLRAVTWSLLFGISIAVGLMAWKGGQLTAWGHWVNGWLDGSSSSYTPVRFEVDLVDQLNYVRMEARLPVLYVDAELDGWLEKEFEGLSLANADEVSHRIQTDIPRYFRVSVCTASGPTLKALLQQFHEFGRQVGGEMTHLACAVRPRSGGLVQEALLVVVQRLEDFSPETISKTSEDAFFSTCPHCQHPHVVRIARQQNSMGLECPQCRRTYAVVAAGGQGNYRYVNEFLTGYAPPSVFAKDHSRVHELFTIWSAVHASCVYTRDPGEQKTTTDSWQTSLETQQKGQGDCEDSAVFLCDWLLTRGFQARVALGRYGDMGGHAWVVVKLDDKEYLLESTEGRPDPTNPPLASRVGSRYVPEVQFDRYALYVRSVPGDSWKGEYWSSKAWTRLEPRSLKARVKTASAARLREQRPAQEARTSRPNPSVAPFTELEEIPTDAAVWQMPLLGPKEKPDRDSAR